MGDQIIMFISQIFNGLKIGSVYSLVALGYTMVYGIAKMLNFAHGDPHGGPSSPQSSCAWRWASSWRGPHTSRFVKRATA